MSNQSDFIPKHIDEIDTSDVESYVGKYVPQRRQNLYYVTYDTIRSFAWAINDYNALYTDPNYARHTKWGDVIAPPGYLYGHGGNPTWARTVGDIPGITMNDNAGEEWEFFQPVRHGDHILSHVKTYDVQKRQGRRAGPLVIVFSERLFRNQHGQVVARNIGSSFRISRGGVVQSGGFAQRVTAQEDGVLREVPTEAPPVPEIWGSPDSLRQDEQRYFEEVNEGDEIPTMDRGIFHPDQGRSRSAATGAISGQWGGGVPVEVRTRPDGPMKIAITAAGVNRTDWFGHFVTQWAGPNAWITKLGFQNREWVVEGYKVIIKGRVTNKHIEGDRHLVDLDMWVENDFGMVTNPGHATVDLPALKPME